MEGFPIELARSILNLELQKDKILKKDKKHKRLCLCRKHILLNYVSVCQLFLIRFSSKIVKFRDDRAAEKTSTVDLRAWYESEIYTKQFTDPNISSKMVLVFKLLQDSLDGSFFDAFEVEFKQAISRCDDPAYKEDISILFDNINEWMENYLLNILTLKIDCIKISDDLLAQHGITENFRCDGTGMPNTGCNRCTDDCPAVIIGHEQYYKEEEIHLYMSEDFDHGGFLTNYFDIMSTYHANPKNIKVIFDFMLYEEPFTFSDSHRNWIEEAKDKFKTVEIINFDLAKA